VSGLALRYGFSVLAVVALLLIGLAARNRGLYSAGVLGCAAVLAAFVGRGLRRSGYGRGWRWVGGVLTAAVAVAVGLGLPWWELRQAHAGNSVWTLTYRATWSTHRGDRIYLSNGASTLAVERRTGRVLGRASHGGEPRALAGAGFAVDFYSRVAAYDSSARLLWERLQSEEGPISLVAATDKTTVVETCRPKTACRFEGIAPDGRTRWSRPSAQMPLWRAYTHSPSSIWYPGGDVLPGVVVWQAGPDALAVADADDGRLLGRVAVPGSRYVGAVGDTVVVSDRPGGYRLRGIRGGRLAWVVNLPAAAPSSDGSESPAPILLLPTRMYASLAGGKGVTVDLKSGDHRVMDLDPLAETVAASDEALVVREGRRVRGLDASSGRVLWEVEAHGGRPPCTYVGAGAVVLLTLPSGNPLLPEETRRNGLLVTVLDARTGRATGRFVSDDGAWETMPVGPGQALVVHGGVARLLGAAPDPP
jgi:hypothetical protein